MSSTATHYVAAAGLLERILSDARFRAAFRQDAASACRAHGLEHLAAQYQTADGPMVLGERESRSTLAGILMAAALESAEVLGWLADSAAAGIDTVTALERALEADPRAIPAASL